MKVAFTFLLLFGGIPFMSKLQEPQQKMINEQLVEFYQNQRFSDAVNLLKTNYPEPITDMKILASMAYASQMAGMLPDAEKYYSRIYELDSSNYHVLFNLGNVNLLRGNELKAKGYFTNFLKKDSSSFVVYKDMAQISTSEGNNDMIVFYLEKANNLQPNNADVASELCNFYIEQKKYALAEKVLSIPLQADKENIYLVESMIRLDYAQHKWKELISNGEQALTLGDHTAYVLNKLGEGYFNSQNYKCAIETFSAIQPVYQNEGTFYFIAECYKQLKDQPKAIAYFDKAIDAGLSPNIDSYYSEIADSYTDQKKNIKAVGAYEKALQFNKKPMTFYMMANLYDTGLNDKKEAVKYYKKFLASKPQEKDKKYIEYSKTRIEALNH